MSCHLIWLLLIHCFLLSIINMLLNRWHTYAKYIYIYELSHCTSFSASSFQEQLVAIGKLQSLWFTSLPKQIFLSANDSCTLSQLSCDYGLAMYHWLLMFDCFSSCFSGRRSVRSHKPRRKLVEAWHRPTWVRFGGLFVSYGRSSSIRQLLQHVNSTHH